MVGRKHFDEIGMFGRQHHTPNVCVYLHFFSPRSVLLGQQLLQSCGYRSFFKPRHKLGQQTQIIRKHLRQRDFFDLLYLRDAHTKVIEPTIDLGRNVEVRTHIMQTRKRARQSHLCFCGCFVEQFYQQAIGYHGTLAYREGGARQSLLDFIEEIGCWKKRHIAFVWMVI